MADTGDKSGIGRWSAGRRRPLRYWGCASRVAGPAGHARAARAGPFAKELPKGVSQTPKGPRKPLAPPGAPSPRFGGGAEKGIRAYPAPQKQRIRAAERWLFVSPPL